MFRGHPHIHGRAIHPKLFVSSAHLRCVRLWFMVFTNHPGSGRDNYSIIIRNRLSDLSLLVAHWLFAPPPVAFIFLAPLADARHFFRPTPTRAVYWSGVPAFLAGRFAGLLAAPSRAVFLAEGSFGVGVKPMLAAMALSFSALYLHAPSLNAECSARLKSYSLPRH